MSHLIIFTLALNLIAGTVVFIYVLGAWRKYGRAFLFTLLCYILSFNGLNLADFSYQYTRTNVFNSDPSLVRESPLLSGILLLIVFCAEFAMAATIFRLVERLKGRVPKRKSSIMLAVWAFCFAAASVYGLLILFRDGQWTFFYTVHAAWVFSMISIILGSLVSGIIFTRNSKGDRNALFPFSLIFLIGYGFFAFSHIDFYFLHSSFIRRIYDPVMLLGINLAPVIWLKWFFEKKNPAAAPGNRDEKLKEFCGEYGISKRECEIIRQVMSGKSNKEIEDALFISPSTVKNHLYNIYQKVGINSRGELISRVLLDR